MQQELTIPEGASGLVIFRTCPGTDLDLPRLQQTARLFNRYKLATLIPGNASADMPPEAMGLNIGHFAMGKAIMRSLEEAADDSDIQAVVSFGGDIEVESGVLQRVEQPVLLIACGRDSAGIHNNRDALSRLNAVSSMNVVSRASRRLLEPGTREEMAELAALWFCRHLE